MTFTGPATGSSAATATLTLSAPDDPNAIDETVTVSIPRHEHGSPKLTASGIRGWVSGGRSGNGRIVLVDDEAPPTPVVSISGGTAVTEGDTASFTLTANPAPSNDVAVNVTVADSGDFADSGQAGSRTVTIGTGGSATLDVTTGDDGQDEPHGTLIATIDSGTGYTVDSRNDSDSVTVSDNDEPRGVTVSTPSLSLTEGGATGSYTVALDSQPTADVTVTVTSDDAGGVKVHGPGGTAGASATLTFTPTNWSAQTVTVMPQDDTDADDETVTISHTVSDTGGYDDMTAASVTVTVDDDETPATPTLSVDIAPASANEGDAGSHYATVTLNLNPARFQATTFKACLSNTGTATHGADADYQFVQASSDTALSLTGGCHDYTIAPNTTSGQVRLQIHGDADVEPDETVVVELRDPPQGVTVSPSAGSATYTILNDDTATPNACVSAQLLSTVQGYAQENHGAEHVKRWERVLAAFGEDNGRTAMTAAEAEQMEAQYSASRWEPVVEALECLEGTVPDPDPEISITGGNAVTEGITASFTLTATPAPSGTITVTVNVVDSGDFANSGQDGSRQVSIGTAGTGTLTVTTDDDNTDETNGSLTATVASGQGYTPSATQSSASVTVNDNDATPNACVSPQLLSTVQGYAQENHGAEHVKRWERVLAAFGEDNGRTAMTAAEAEQMEAQYSASRWEPVVEALECLEGTVPDPDPEISITGGNAVTEGGTASFTLTATPAPSSAITVTVNLVDSGDFANSGQAGSRTVSIGTGGTGTLTVTTDDDNSDEPNGSLTATVIDGNGYTPSATQGSASVTVNDDDDPPPGTPVVAFTSASSSAGEAAGTRNVTLNLTPPPASGITVHYSVGGTATEGSDGDFTITDSGNVQVAAGAGSATIAVAINDDSADEPGETVELTLTDTADYDLGATRVHTLTITDNDDPPPVVSIADGNAITEGDNASFTLTATPPPSGTITVTVIVVDNGDFANSSQTGSRTVVIGTGGTGTLTVTTDDDNADETNGSLTATVASGQGYTVAASPNDAAQVTVADDDVPAGSPTLSVLNVEADESEWFMRFTVELSHLPPELERGVGFVFRTWESTPVSARQGKDYKHIEGTRRFRQGDPLTMEIKVFTYNDSHDDPDETFELVISHATGAAIADAVGVARSGTPTRCPRRG